MANITTKIRVYLETNGKDWLQEKSNKSFKLQDNSDGSGIVIVSWNVAGLAQPTEEQLDALDAQANDMEALNQVLANRKAEYPSIEDLVVALYDTDDKAAIDSKRAEIKLKYPKP